MLAFYTSFYLILVKCLLKHVLCVCVRVCVCVCERDRERNKERE